MIKKYSLLLLLLFLSNYISAQHHVPSFEKIVTTFFTNYDVRTGQDSESIRFIKQKEGYFIEEYDATKKAYHMKTFFWSAVENDYKTLNFPVNTNSKIAQIHIQYHLNDLNKELFNNLPYYGYTGWPKDVINYLEKKKKLSNKEYYALGRAYSSRASHLLNDSFEFADISEQFNLKESGKNQFSNEQLKTYKKYVNKSIKNYTYLCDKEPGYLTIVGSICTKLNNEYVTAFLNLSIYQNEEEAMKFLPDGLYSDYFIDYAKNFLNSVAPNGILFTTGDNDTFPFLYAQGNLKIRPDVTIVNVSLLNQNSYVNHLRDDVIFGTDPIQFTLTKEVYSKEKLDYVVFESDTISQEYLDIKDVLGLINAKDPSVIYKYHKEYGAIPSNKIHIELTEEKKIKLDYDIPYILRGELLALDIIQTNIAHRPIHCQYMELPVLGIYLEKTGLGYKLTANPRNQIKSDPSFTGIDMDKTFSLLVENFKPHEITKKSNTINGSILFEYTYSFLLLAKQYQKMGDVKKCNQVVSTFIDFYPKDRYLSFSLTILDIAKTAYANNSQDNGAVIFDYLLKNLEYKQNQYNKEEDIRSPYNKKQLNKYLYVLTDMNTIETKHSNFKQRIDILMNYFKIEYDKLDKL